MLTFHEIDIELNEKQAIVWLNQPESRNALNPLMIDDLIKGFEWMEHQKEIRIILIRGRGHSFCAGADINWMNDSGSSGYRTIYSESKKLASCFRTIYQSNKVVINLIHGHTFGGGLGFIGAGDFSFALKEALFGLPELKLGLAPSVITPYLLTRVKQSALKLKIYTGKSFSSEEALDMGLIDGVFNDIHEMEIKFGEMIHAISSVSSEALQEYKKLLRQVNKNTVNRNIINKTIRSITRLKMSTDARNRMSEFMMRKNKPK